MVFMHTDEGAAPQNEPNDRNHELTLHINSTAAVVRLLRRDAEMRAPDYVPPDYASSLVHRMETKQPMDDVVSYVVRTSPDLSGVDYVMSDCIYGRLPRRTRIVHADGKDARLVVHALVGAPVVSVFRAACNFLLPPTMFSVPIETVPGPAHWDEMRQMTDENIEIHDAVAYFWDNYNEHALIFSPIETDGVINWLPASAILAIIDAGMVIDENAGFTYMVTAQTRALIDSLIDPDTGALAPAPIGEIVVHCSMSRENKVEYIIIAFRIRE